MKFTNTEVFNFKGALRGMRNPLNSWDKSDSNCVEGRKCSICPDNQKCDFYFSERGTGKTYRGKYYIGENDLKLAQSLIKAGAEHCKFMRMIHVCVDVDMPRYWWSEEDTYHFNTKNSCSTMHKLLNNVNPITRDLFVLCDEDLDIADLVIERLETLRVEFKQSKDNDYKNRLLVRAKRLLMEGFLQLRTLDTTYAELRSEYFQRRNHRLKEEWQDTFCKWIESLPYAKELIMLDTNNLV